MVNFLIIYNYIISDLYFEATLLSPNIRELGISKNII